MPAPHLIEFRQRAVELARKGDKPVSVLAEDLGISDSCLRIWMRQADTDDNGGAKLTSAVRFPSPAPLCLVVPAQVSDQEA